MKATVAEEAVTTPPAPATPAPVKPVVGASIAALPLALLSLGHWTVDLYSSIIATLQPLLVERYSLSLTQAGIVAGTFMFSSSVLQLPFGVLSDRLHSRLFSVLSPAVAGLFLSSLFWATGFPMLLALVSIGGIAVAAFHPLSTKEASVAGGARRGLSVGIFITSGTFGLAVGPTYFSTVIKWAGEESLTWAALPALAVTAILFWKLPETSSKTNGVVGGVDFGLLKRHWRGLSLHYSLVLLRSVVQVGIAQFLTLYLYNERGFSFSLSSLGLTLFFLSAATGAFLGGNLADRIGGRRVVLLSMLGSTPFLALFVASSGWLSIASLFVGGVILLLTIPVIVVMAQDLVPSQAGTVSGMMMGFSWGIAGMASGPGIGWLADHVGIQPVFWVLALLPMVGFVLALNLRNDRARTV